MVDTCAAPDGCSFIEWRQTGTTAYIARYQRADGLRHHAWPHHAWPGFGSTAWRLCCSWCGTIFSATQAVSVLLVLLFAISLQSILSIVLAANPYIQLHLRRSTCTAVVIPFLIERCKCQCMNSSSRFARAGAERQRSKPIRQIMSRQQAASQHLAFSIGNNYKVSDGFLLLARLTDLL